MKFRDIEINKNEDSLKYLKRMQIEDKQESQRLLEEGREAVKRLKNLGI